MKILNSISRVFSLLFHPIVIPLYAVFLIFNSTTIFTFIPDSIKNLTYLIVIVSTLLLPLSILPLLKFQKIISSYRLTDRRERIIPIILSMIFYFMGFYLTSKLPMTSIILALYKSLMLAIMGVGFVSLYWKMSIHMTSLGGILAIILYLNIYYQANSLSWIMLAILICGIQASSRLLLGRHTPLQVYVGFSWGLISVFTSLIFS